MKLLKVLIVLNFFFFMGCGKFKGEKKFDVLGDDKSSKILVYLCGLVEYWDVAEEVEHRKILNDLGSKYSLKIIAVRPFSRSSNYNGKMCWLHDTFSELSETYHRILGYLKSVSGNVVGWIGFSNGGFFLNQLVQKFPLGVPVISIGAAGFLHKSVVRNNLFLLCGRQDVYHFEHAQNFFIKASNILDSKLIVKFIDYDCGHQIQADALDNALSVLF